MSSSSMEVVFQIFKIFKIVLCSTGLVLNCYKACFVDFQLFRSYSSEVVFNGGRLPNFQNFQNYYGLYRTSPTIVTNHVLLISNYLGHFPVRSSTREVVFQIFKILNIVLGSTGLVLQMLQSMFC